MSTFELPGNFSQLGNALLAVERRYLTAGSVAARQLEDRLHQFSKDHPLPTIRGAMQQFPQGKCLIAVNDALEASNKRVGEMLLTTLKGLDFDMVRGVLWHITKDIALYMGGGAVIGGAVGGALGFLAAGVGAVPGAVVGAEVGLEIGGAIMALIGLKDLAMGIVHVVPALYRHMSQGFACAMRAALLPDSARAERGKLMASATESFAQGKFILVVGLLAAIVALIAHKGLTVALEKIGGSKLGSRFGEWLKKNHEIVRKHPALQPPRPAAAQGPAKAAAAEKPGPVKTDNPKAANDAPPGQGKAKIPCPTCVLVANPINPILGSKVFAGAIDLDFALPAPLPLVWQRTYSSAQRQAGWLGAGWSTPLSLSLQVNADSVVVLDPYARDITFSLPALGESLYSPSEKITLIRTHDRSFELVDDKGERELFALPETASNIARLVGKADANGNRIRIDYDQRQLPVRVEDSAGRIYLLEFRDHQGHPRLRAISMQRAAPETGNELLVEYEFDAAGNLAKVSNGNGDVTRGFNYRNHVMVEHSQPGGIVSRYEYDEYAASGKVTRNWTNTGLSWTLRYLAQETVVTDNLGREERYRFDDQQRFIGKVDAAGGVTAHRLDTDGNILSVTDAGGRSVSYRYDQRGRVIRIESGGGGTGIVYDSRFDKPALITDAMGATTVLRYDEHGNLASVTDALGHKTSYQYDQLGMPVRITDAAGGVKRLVYNRAAQLISYTDCSNNSTHFSYDSKGKLVCTTDAAGNATAYSYDLHGRLVSVRHPDGATERYEYDLLGRLASRIDAAGNATRYVFGSNGKLVKRVNALGGVLEYRYDEAHRIAELINENGDAHRFIYDALDRLVEETGFDARLIRYRYDGSGMVVAKEEFGSNERSAYTRIDTHFSRDSAGQLTEKTVSRATGEASAEQIVVRFAYDAVGRMTRAINTAAEVNLEYDPLGRLVGEHTKTREDSTALRHAYDELGNRIQTTLPDGRVLNNLFYGSGHLHQINVDGEVITDIERDRLHRAVSRTQGALTSQFTYDPVGRLLAQVSGQVEVGQGAEPVIARRYEYDEAGNLLAIDDKRNGRKQYAYDVIGRILSAVQPDQSERFAFDPAHNLLDTTVAATGRVEGNRVRVFEDKRYDYDAHGNLTEKLTGKHTRLQLEWNAAHELVKSTTTRHAQESTPTVQAVQYTYDPFGRRIAKKDRFGVSRFVWDGNRLLCETRGQWMRTYVYEPGSFVPLTTLETVRTEPGPLPPCTVHHVHVDHLGTPHELTAEDGEVVWAAQHRVWGNLLTTPAMVKRPRTAPVVDPESAQQAAQQAQPIRFLGQYHDSETGLHYNRFRYYDADCGRYVSVDPIGLAGGNNSYQYAANPVSWSDPLGLTALCTCKALLDYALKQQGFKPGDPYPAGFKLKWSENGYKYEVRIHGPDATAPPGSISATQDIYRVARKSDVVDAKGQGKGWEYVDDVGNWYAESFLKTAKTNPAANAAAKATHIPVPTGTIP